MVDDNHAPAPSTFQWLLHAFEKFEIDPTAGGQSITSRRRGVSLFGQLYASTGLSLSQTDAWPIEPDEGYVTLARPIPAKRWHLTAETERVDRVRIACVFCVQGPGEDAPDVSVTRAGERLVVRWGQRASGEIELSSGSNRVLQVSCGLERLEIEA